MEQITEYIKQKYTPLSIILYGSYANGTNNPNSDFDALVISYDHEQFHDTSFVNGIQLDVFVYPASYFDGNYDCNDFIQIFDGKIIADNNGRGKALQTKNESPMSSLTARWNCIRTPPHKELGELQRRLQLPYLILRNSKSTSNAISCTINDTDCIAKSHDQVSGSWDFGYVHNITG